MLWNNGIKLERKNKCFTFFYIRRTNQQDTCRIMVQYGKLTILYIVVFHAVVFISIPVEADISVITQTYKLSLTDCNYTVEKFTPTLKPSLIMCALKCMGIAYCESFVTRGLGCELLKTCPRNCTEAAESDESWNLYCPECKALSEINFHFRLFLCNKLCVFKNKNTQWFS